MSTAPVTLDFSKSQPLSLDFSKAQPITPPAPSTAASPSLTDNPNGEGVYPMVNSAGATVSVPYSKVSTAAEQGHRFQTKDALQQYARDHAADPVSEGAVDKYIDGLGWYNPVKLGRDVLAGGGAGIMKTVTGMDRAPQGHGAGGEIEQDMQLAAATPTHGVAAGAGELAENVGEWFSGEELLGMLGKAAQTMGLGERLKAANGLAQVIEKNPMVGKLLKIGSSAVKQAAIGGAQTYAKTGDAKTAAEAGAATAVANPVLEKSSLALTGRIQAMMRAAGEGKLGANFYAQQARGAVEDHLREIEGAIAPHPGVASTSTPKGAAEESHFGVHGRPTAQRAGAPAAANAEEIAGGRNGAIGSGDTSLTTRNQVGPTRAQNSVEFEAERGLPGRGTHALPGGAAATGSAASQAAARAAADTSAFNVDRVLNTVHDFNGAKDRLQQVAAPMYDALDVATNGKFRTLNAEVTAAQKAAYRAVAGTPEKATLDAAYDNKVREMDALIDSTKGVVRPEIVQAAKGAFRQSYLLDDFATIWDRNLEGVPGNTKASTGQRGVNGRGLMRDLTSAVNKKGRPLIERTLGPGRLDNLEAIARANDTVTKRTAFGEGVRNVARNMAHGAMIGGLGSEVMGLGYKPGAAAGAAAIAATYAPQVMKAIATNPKIGQTLIYAIEYGARPEAYGPMIAKMIQDSEKQQEAPQQ